jgi:hypothetical protein
VGGVPAPVPGEGKELIEVTAAPLNNIDRVRADGSHYSVRSGQYASGGLPAVPGVIGAGRLPGRQRVLFGSRCGTMAQYAAAAPEMTFAIPGGLDDAVAAAAWNPGMSAWLTFGWRYPLQPGQTVLILGATGVTGKRAVQAARHFGAGRIVAAGRNQQVLGMLPGLGADAVIQLSHPADAVASARSTGATPTWGPDGSACSRPARWRAHQSHCRAGAHVDLDLAPGLRRSYSLCGDPTDERRWQVAVLRETAVLEGDVDHRDSLLTPAEQAAGDTMFICVSRSRSQRLVIDL